MREERMVTFHERINRGKVIVLDGAMGTDLTRRGVTMHNVAWRVAGLLTHPELVRQLHKEYIEIGAEVIITNTFSTCRNVLGEVGLGDQVRKLNTLAVELAIDAREQASGDQVLIAGSISSMAPGNNLGRMPAAKQAKANYREQANVLAETGVDIMILEMMRDLEQTSYALEAARSTGLTRLGWL